MALAMTLLVPGAACYLCLALWLYWSQQRMVYRPTRTVEGTPREVGLEYRDLTLTNRLGTSIHAWWVPCDNARFTLLFAHGNGGNMGHRLESLRIFHDLGLSVLLFDYSGYGQSHGEPSETATRADARTAWDWLVRDQHVAPDSILLFGRSLGGAVAAGLAAELAADGLSPRAMILESTFTSIPDVGAQRYPWLPVRSLARYRYDTATALADLRLPVLFAHAPEDATVPFDLGRRLYEEYRGPKYFLPLCGGHNNGFLLMGEAYPEGMARFLDCLSIRP